MRSMVEGELAEVRDGRAETGRKGRDFRARLRLFKLLRRLFRASATARPSRARPRHRAERGPPFRFHSMGDERRRLSSPARPRRGGGPCGAWWRGSAEGRATRAETGRKDGISEPESRLFKPLRRIFRASVTARPSRRRSPTTGLRAVPSPHSAFAPWGRSGAGVFPPCATARGRGTMRSMVQRASAEVRAARAETGRKDGISEPELRLFKLLRRLFRAGATARPSQGAPPPLR